MHLRGTGCDRRPWQCWTLEAGGEVSPPGSEKSSSDHAARARDGMLARPGRFQRTKFGVTKKKEEVKVVSKYVSM